MNLHGMQPKRKDWSINQTGEGIFTSFYYRILKPGFNWDDFTKSANIRVALYTDLNISAAPGDTVTIMGEERVLA